MCLTELARQTALEIAEGTAVIFLGVGMSVGTNDERKEGKGIVGSGELTRAIADRFGIELKRDAAGGLQSTLMRRCENPACGMSFPVTRRNKRFCNASCRSNARHYL